jgi:gliding motility-associated-like protein
VLLLTANVNALVGQTFKCPTNIDFEIGNLSIWKPSTGKCCPIVSNTAGAVGGRHTIISGTGTDAFGGFPIMPNGGGNFVLKLGNTNTGAEAEKMSYHIRIPSGINDYGLIYRYAVVFQNPGHSKSEQPRFEVKTYDSATNKLIDCNTHTYIAASNITGFLQSKVNTTVYYKPWSTATINLSGYAGKTVIIDIATGDCSQGGHFGYGYVDFSCGLYKILTVACKKYPKSTLTAPTGFESYKWLDSTKTKLLGTGISLAVDSISQKTKYYVVLYPYTGFGCIDTLSTIVTITDVVSKFKISSTQEQCLAKNAFTFSNASNTNSSPLGSLWNFGDGSTSTTNSPTKNYTTADSFKVRLIVETPEGCRDTSTNYVIVNPNPIVNYNINDTDQCYRNNLFVFNNTSAIGKGSMSYQWYFGDNSTSNATSPSKTYSVYGNYPVKLKVSSNKGCTDSITKTVVVYEMPKAKFTLNDSDQCFNNHNFVFTNLSSLATGSNNYFWNFGDATSSIINSPTKNYTTADSFRVQLIVVSNNNCQDTMYRPLVTYPNPMVNYNINDTDQCYRDNLFVFNNTSAIGKGSMSYQWYFGDNSTSNATSPSKTYNVYGNYPVKLKVNSDKGCTDSITKTVVVYEMPKAKFTLNDSGQCFNDQKFILNDISTIITGTISRKWVFDDGVFSNQSYVNKTFIKDTFHAIKLVQTSDRGCKDSISKMIEVYPKPFPLFTINDTDQCLKQNNFVFTNGTTLRNGGLNYEWKFGDNSKITSTNPSHQFLAFGNYVVTLTAISNEGCIDSLKKPVQVYPMPIASFTINDPSQCFRIQNFVYSNTSTLAFGSMNSKWFFGDLDTINSFNSNHIYQTIGNYFPKLIMTSNYGCKDSISQTIIVNPNTKASYKINDSDQCINQQNYLFTSTSKLITGQIKGVLWNLGNGKTSIQHQTSSIYPRSGIYTIILQTTTDSGCVDSFSNKIRIYPKPKAWFDMNDSAQCLFQNNYQFNDLSYDSLGLNLFNWNINNESQQTTKVANYIFGTSGYKTITLIATSIKGCDDTVKRMVYVKPMPDPKFELLNNYYCELTGPYNFKPVTLGGSYYGKNIQSNIYNPVILWEDTVKHIVTVNGCTDSSSQFTNVYTGPRVDLGNDTTLCKFEAIELIVNSWRSKIVWNDGSTNSYLRVMKPGIYSVTATNVCGKKRDSIEVLFRDINCRFFLPTAFTPNHDGLNDRFKPIIYNVGEMKYQIFSRWGELIFEGNESDEGWDGTFKGEMVQLGNYLIHVTYSYASGKHSIKMTESGMFILIR